MQQLHFETFHDARAEVFRKVSLCTSQQSAALNTVLALDGNGEGGKQGNDIWFPHQKVQHFMSPKNLINSHQTVKRACNF